MKKEDTSVRGKLMFAAVAAGLLVPRLSFAQEAAPDAARTGPAGSNAIEKAEKEVLPLSPEKIRELGARFRDVGIAKEQATTEVAAPNNRRINVSFMPGSATSIINTVKGYPTAISFFDQTGQPWPISWDTNSNPAGGVTGNNCGGAPSTASNGGSASPAIPAVGGQVGFIVCTPVKGSNVLEVTPMSLQPRGGLVVTLEGAPKPITFLLKGGGDTYDADVSIEVAARGPNAKTQVVTEPHAPDTGAPYLTALLDGIPPADAVPMSVTGVSPDDLRAWELGNRIFIRTRHLLLAPEWTASEHGEGGLTVYAVPETPVVLLSADGRTISAALKKD
jgi:intracellular multiplication protein IcmK